VLRKILRSKREKVTGCMWKLCTEGLHDSVLLAKYYLGDKIKQNEMEWACGLCGGEKKCIQAFHGAN
jgi:hypothetical protein